MPDEPDGELLKRFVQGDLEAFESLFKRFQREVYGWILRIVRDTGAADDVLVERRTRWQATAEDLPAPVGVDRDLAESVALAFRSLPPKLQIVATLALIEERPYADIADALDVPVGTVKS